MKNLIIVVLKIIFGMLKSNAYNISSQILHYGFYHNMSEQDSGRGTLF